MATIFSLLFLGALLGLEELKQAELLPTLAVSGSLV
jgi:hypothetical protein